VTRISVAIAGIFGKCDSICTFVGAPLKSELILHHYHRVSAHGLSKSLSLFTYGNIFKAEYTISRFLAYSVIKKTS
jgi:hypothetical protein